MAFLAAMLIEIFFENRAAERVVWASDHRKLARVQMFFQVTLPDHNRALIIGAGNTQFHHQPPDRDIRFQLASDPLVAQWALSGLLDAVKAEEVVATGCFHSVIKDVQTNWAQPPIVAERGRREVRKLGLQLDGLRAHLVRAMRRCF